MLKSMLKRLLVLLIITQLLFNGVWATAHTTEGDHDSHNVPHLHFDIENHVAINKVTDDTVITANPDHETDEHHEHFHIHLNVFLKTDELKLFEKRTSMNPVSFKNHLTSLRLSPPVPPPTAYT